MQSVHLKWGLSYCECVRSAFGSCQLTAYKLEMNFTSQRLVAVIFNPYDFFNAWKYEK